MQMVALWCAYESNRGFLVIAATVILAITYFILQVSHSVRITLKLCSAFLDLE